MKRFNTKTANELVNITLNNENVDFTDSKQHEPIRQKCRSLIYDKFGWTKGAIRYINTKLNREIINYYKK